MPSSGVQKCALDRKSTRLNSSHGSISYAVFCLKKKKGSAPCLSPVTHAPHIALTGYIRRRHTVGRASGVQGRGWGADRDWTSGVFFFFNDPATTELYPLSLHDPLPIFTLDIGPPALSGLELIHHGRAVTDAPV